MTTSTFITNSPDKILLILRNPSNVGVASTAIALQNALTYSISQETCSESEISLEPAFFASECQCLNELCSQKILEKIQRCKSVQDTNFLSVLVIWTWK